MVASKTECVPERRIEIRGDALQGSRTAFGRTSFRLGARAVHVQSGVVKRSVIRGILSSRNVQSCQGGGIMMQVREFWRRKSGGRIERSTRKPEGRVEVRVVKLGLKIGRRLGNT